MLLVVMWSQLVNLSVPTEWRSAEREGNTFIDRLTATGMNGSKIIIIY
jgi:hypothetical protein